MCILWWEWSYYCYLSCKSSLLNCAMLSYGFSTSEAEAWLKDRFLFCLFEDVHRRMGFPKSFWWLLATAPCDPWKFAKSHHLRHQVAETRKRFSPGLPADDFRKEWVSPRVFKRISSIICLCFSPVNFLQKSPQNFSSTNLSKSSI